MHKLTCCDFAAEHYPPIESVISGGILDKNGITILSGEPGTGKSLLTLQLAMNIANGDHFLGYLVPRPQNTLLIMKEVPPATIQHRLLTQNKDDTAYPKTLWIDTDPLNFYLDEPVVMQATTHWLKKNKIEVVIIDPLIEFHHQDENDAKGMRAGVIDPLRAWQQLGLSIFIVHHHAKSNEDNPREGLNKMRGSSTLGGAIDTNVQLSTLGGYTRVLSFAKLRNHDHPHSVIKLTFDPLKWTFSRTDSLYTIQELLKAHPELSVPEAVEEAVNRGICSRATAYRKIVKLRGETSETKS